MKGWRVHWTLSTSGDRFIGALWHELETAEWIADMIRRTPACVDIEIRRWAA